MFIFGALNLIIHDKIEWKELAIINKIADFERIVRWDMENNGEPESRLYHFQSTSDNIQDIKETQEQIHQIGIFLKESLRAKNLAIFIGSGCSTPDIPMMGVTMKKIL